MNLLLCYDGIVNDVEIPKQLNKPLIFAGVKIIQSPSSDLMTITESFLRDSFAKISSY